MDMIKVFLAITFCLTLFTLSCSGAVQWERLENFNGQFSIDYPAGWTFEDLAEDSGELHISFKLYDGLNARAAMDIMVINEPYFDTRDSWVNDSLWNENILMVDEVSPRGFLYTVFGGGNDILQSSIIIAWINETQTMFLTSKVANGDDYTINQIFDFSKIMLDSITIE